MNFNEEKHLKNYDEIVSFVELICQQLFSKESSLHAVRIRKANLFMLEFDKFVKHLRGQTRPYTGIIEIFVEDSVVISSYDLIVLICHEVAHCIQWITTYESNHKKYEWGCRLESLKHEEEAWDIAENILNKLQLYDLACPMGPFRLIKHECLMDYEREDPRVVWMQGKPIYEMN